MKNSVAGPVTLGAIFFAFPTSLVILSVVIGPGEVP
jgi:hypothetical protein